MPKETPRRGQAAGRGLENSVNGRADSRPALTKKQPRPAPAPPVDLIELRGRLLGARRRLVERIALEYGPDRAYPDTAWTRMLADIQIAIAAVDAVAAEDGG